MSLPWLCGRCGSWNQAQDNFCGFCLALELKKMEDKKWD